MIEGVILSMDMPPKQYESILLETSDLERVCGYKFDIRAAVSGALAETIAAAKDLSPEKRVIYDHQTSMHNTGTIAEELSCEIAELGVDEVMLHPLPGMFDDACTWLCAARDAGMDTIVDAWMTAPHLTRNNGGMYRAISLLELYIASAREGVTAFGVPGNKPAAMQRIQNVLSPYVPEQTLYPTAIGVGEELKGVENILSGTILPIVGQGGCETKDLRNMVRKLP